MAAHNRTNCAWPSAIRVRSATPVLLLCVSLESGNEKRRPLSSHLRRLTYHLSVYVALLWITRSLVFQNFFFLYEPAARGSSSRVSRSLTGSLSVSPALNCSVEFAATGQIHVVSCCPHQVSVPQCRRDSNLYGLCLGTPSEAAREVKLAGKAKGIVAYIQPAGKGALWCEPASTGAQARSVQSYRAAMKRVGCPRRMQC